MLLAGVGAILRFTLIFFFIVSSRSLLKFQLHCLSMAFLFLLVLGQIPFFPGAISFVALFCYVYYL